MRNLRNIHAKTPRKGVYMSFSNCPRDRGSIPSRIIPNTQKCYLIFPCLTLSIIRYRSRIKWSNTGKGVALFSAPRCSSYRKESLWVTLDYYYIEKMVREIWVQSLVESYHKLKKWYLMPPCLTLRIIRYGSKFSGAFQEKEPLGVHRL